MFHRDSCENPERQCKYANKQIKLTDILNNCLTTRIFQDKFKLAEISPIFEANDNTSKKNYRPGADNTDSAISEKKIMAINMTSRVLV